MPGPDETRRQQTINPAMKELGSSIPKVEFDPQAMRRKLAEQFRPSPHRCVICGTSLSPAGNCPRCLNLIV